MEDHVEEHRILSFLIKVKLSFYSTSYVPLHLSPDLKKQKVMAYRKLKEAKEKY